MSDHILLCCLPAGPRHHATIDAEDFDRASKLTWNVCYRRRSIYADAVLPNGKRIYLHRFILNAPRGLWIDHRDGNGLNCAKGNLRPSTPSQNRQNAPARKNNSTGFKGVRTTGSGRFSAVIGVNGKSKHLGTYDTAQDAAIAYDLAAIRFFGEYARTNVVL